MDDMAMPTDLPVLIGIDVGTSSIRALAFDLRGEKLAGAARPTPMTAVATGGEYDPDLIFATVLSVLAEVGAALAGRPVAGMAVGSLGESCVLVDEAGRAVAPAIVWYDRRSEPQERALSAKIDPAHLFAVTGQAIDFTFTLCKLAWMHEHWPEPFGRARRVLMMADWIAYRLSGEAATDPTLASRTLYFDIHRREWAGDLLDAAGVDPRLASPLKPSGAALGSVRREILAETGLAGTPSVGVGGHDHLVGSFAAGLVAPGMVLDSQGTAERILLATEEPLRDPEVRRRGYSQSAIGTNRRMSYLGGGNNSHGGAIDWLRSITGNPPHAEMIAEAESVPAGSNGVVFLPHLGGSPPPTLDLAGRGAFVGLTSAATRGVLYRAVLEGLAMQSRLMIDGMTSLPGLGAASQFRVVGGGTRNPLLLAIKASVLDRPLVVVEEAETTALGAALLGAVAAGVYRDLDDALASLDRKEHTVEPGAEAGRYEALRTVAFEPLYATLRLLNRALAAFEEESGARPK
jgi:xylulokinase